MRMDSKLINYTKLSPNCTKMNDKKIRKITIHHMAGNLTVEACGNCFQGNRQASANYGIGSDGRVGLYVHECDRAWTSSNRDNDSQAITIEVANDKLSPTWSVSAQAYEKLIQLCTDICERYDITPVYDGTKNGTFTEHCMFKSTLCPGPYLHGRMPAIVAEVKRRLGINTVKAGELVKDDHYVWDRIYREINNEYGTAAIMGNLKAESNIYANNLQNSFNTKFGMSDDEYTTDVDTGKYTNFVKDGAGYGIAQWTFWTRKAALLEYAKSNGCSISNLEMQVGFLMNELKTTYSGLYAYLKCSKDLYTATETVLKQFEKPADTSERIVKERFAYALEIMNKYAITKNLYRVQVGAYKNKKNAQNVLNSLKSNGFKDAFIVVVNGLYKIQVGSYSNYNNAKSMINIIKNNGYGDAWIAEVTI